MFGKDPRLNTLEVRKQLLVAACELHRTQLAEEIEDFSTGARRLLDYAASFSSMAAFAMTLCAGLAALKRGKPVAEQAKPSWVQTVLQGAGWLSSLWRKFRAPEHDRD